MRLWGIPIRIHVSLLVLLAIVAVTAKAMEGWPGVIWNMSVLVIVFTSIVLHELAHSLVAMSKGCRVRNITLLFIGGAAQMEEIPKKPRDEIQMAFAGPVFSLLLAAAAWFGGSYLPLPAILPSLWGHQALNLVQLAGQINLGLALFNLIPAFPMDGGRVLRALMARRIGRLPATFIASRLGRLGAIIMAIVGCKKVFSDQEYQWWGVIIIAVFLFQAAGNEFDAMLRQELQETMDKLTDWATGSAPSRQPPAEDIGGQVKISPPPYAKGKGTVSDSTRSDS